MGRKNKRGEVAAPIPSAAAAVAPASPWILGPARDMLLHVATGLDHWLRRWDRGANFTEVRSHWLLHAKGLSQRIEVRLPGREHAGVFEDIDEKGMLRDGIGEA